MDFEKLTQKSAEALNDAKRLAEDNSNPSVEQSHVLSALLSQNGGIMALAQQLMGP